MKRIVFTFILFFCSSFVVVVSAQTKCAPLDDAKKDVVLMQFVLSLKKAIIAKDQKALLALVADDVVVAKDSIGKKEQFKSRYLSLASVSTTWKNLERFVNLGGTYYSKVDDKNKYGFVFPYIANCTSDCFAAVLTSNNINIRDQANAEGRVGAHLSYEILARGIKIEGGQISFPKDSGEWCWIEALDDRVKGYVNRKYLYFMSEGAFFVSKRNGAWLITAYLPGVCD
jgi:hypothetical protein